MEWLDWTAAESIEIRNLHSLVADLGECQLSMKRELKDDMNDIKTTLHSLWDLLIGRSDQNCENGRGKKNDDVVEVLNISSDSSSLATRSKNNATNTASRRKGKGFMRSPIKLRSPIRTRQYTERRDGKTQVVGLFITTKALSEIDQKLINHVFYPTNNASEVFVKSSVFHLNREEFMSYSQKYHCQPRSSLFALTC
ncbi:unnamed protein product [Linum trigynum]|uniref:Uncharacterized protein n=1 Tax=Linum trigynum TaxID=586398 RepID=A0AAV2EAV9_9ROSI